MLMNVEDVQQERFGVRYRGACIAKCDYSEENTQKLQAWMAKPSGFLVLYGEPGTSKTYMMAAMIPWALANGPWVEGRNGKPGYQLPSDFRVMRETDFFSYIRKEMMKYGASDYHDTVRILSDIDVFFLDDLGASQGSTWQEEVMTSFIDARYASMKPTIFSTNLQPNKVSEHYGSRIPSRLFAHDNVLLHIVGYDHRKPQV